MSVQFIYIVAFNKQYLTNVMNVTALWEVVAKKLGHDTDIEFSYQLEDGDEYTTEVGRQVRVKKLCQNVFRNRLMIHRTGDMDGDFLTVFQDHLRGKGN